GWTLVLVLGAVAVVVAAILPAFSGALILLLTIPAAAILLIWASVRLVLYAETAALAPRGVPVLRTSWDLAAGRWWGLLGRTLLMGLVVTVAVSVASVPLSVVVAATDSIELWAVAQLVSTVLTGVGTTVSAV